MIVLASAGFYSSISTLIFFSMYCNISISYLLASIIDTIPGVAAYSQGNLLFYITSLIAFLTVLIPFCRILFGNPWENPHFRSSLAFSIAFAGSCNVIGISAVFHSDLIFFIYPCILCVAGIIITNLIKGLLLWPIILGLEFFWGGILDLEIFAIGLGGIAIFFLSKLFLSGGKSDWKYNADNWANERKKRADKNFANDWIWEEEPIGERLYREEREQLAANEARAREDELRREMEAFNARLRIERQNEEEAWRRADQAIREERMRREIEQDERRRWDGDGF